MEVRKAREAEEKAKQEAIAAKEKAGQCAIEVTKAREAVEKARQDVIAAEEKVEQHVTEARQAEERAKKEVEEPQVGAQDIHSDVYEGDFQLVIPIPKSAIQIRQFMDALEKVEGLSILWSGGTADGGMIINISAHKPMNLIYILNEMSVVEKVYTQHDQIMVMLSSFSTN